MINFEIPDKKHIDISIYSPDGKKIKTILNKTLEGKQKVRFNRNNLISGIYIISLKTSEGIVSKKLIVQ